MKVKEFLRKIFYSKPTVVPKKDLIINNWGVDSVVCNYCKCDFTFSNNKIVKYGSTSYSYVECPRCGNKLFMHNKNNKFYTKHENTK